MSTVVVEEDVKSLGFSMFKNCTALKSLTIPAGLDCVGNYVAPIFAGCTNIETITFTESGSWYNYGSNYEYTPWQLSKNALTKVVISEGVTTIGDYAFKDCTGLKELTVPASLNCVGSNTASIFSGCTNIETITFTGSGSWYNYGKSWSEDSYYGYTPWQLSKDTLTKVVISEGVTTIGDYAFKDCTALTELDFADSVVSIGTSAFEGCISLATLKFTNPSISIGDYAFKGCVSLKELTVPASLNCVGSNTAPIFSGCTNIETITFNGSGSWYDYEGYYKYTPWQFSYNALTKVVISEGVTTVGDYALFH